MQITIALTRFSEPSSLVSQALRSLAPQEGVKADVVFFDQCADPELKLFCENLSNKNIVFHYFQIEPNGVSFSRNQAIKLCQTDVILFTEPDVIAHNNWAFHLSDTLVNKGAAVAGGKIIPKYHQKPSFLIKSSLVRDQHSLIDFGEGLRNVGRVVGTSLGINIARMGAEACFVDGRSKGSLVGRADIEICERAIKNRHQVMYNGKAVVTHQILPERLTYKWLFKRFYSGGKTKAKKVGRLQRTPTNPKNSWDYLAIPFFLLPYLYGYFSYKLVKK